MCSGLDRGMSCMNQTSLYICAQCFWLVCQILFIDSGKFILMMETCCLVSLSIVSIFLLELYLVF